MKNEGNDKKKHSSALKAAAIGRSATQQVTHHSGGGALETTGTNTVYEGASAPGSGGSVGDGYASGKQAVDPTISVNSDYAQNREGSLSKAKKAEKAADNAELEDDELDEEDLDDEDIEAEEDDDTEEEDDEL